jgi:hypothetical protein
MPFELFDNCNKIILIEIQYGLHGIHRISHSQWYKYLSFSTHLIITSMNLLCAAFRKIYELCRLISFHSHFFEYLFRLLASILTIFRSSLKILTGFFAGIFGIQLVIFPKVPVHNTLTTGAPRTLPLCIQKSTEIITLLL